MSWNSRAHIFTITVSEIAFHEETVGFELSPIKVRQELLYVSHDLCKCIMFLGNQHIVWWLQQYSFKNVYSFPVSKSLCISTPGSSGCLGKNQTCHHSRKITWRDWNKKKKNAQLMKLNLINLWIAVWFCSTLITSLVVLKYPIV